jgi:hypothetical protein
MRNSKTLFSILVATLFCFTLAATATSAVQLPAPKTTEQGVRYLNGGIGKEQRAAMENINGFNLKLVFADGNGKYISDVAVTIKDADGNQILSHNDAGPWLMADLPKGSYRMEAVVNGEPIRKQVRIGDGMRTLNLSW